MPALFFLGKREDFSASGTYHAECLQCILGVYHFIHVEWARVYNRCSEKCGKWPLGFLIYIFDVTTFLVEIGVIAYYRRFLSVRGFLVLIGHCTLQLLTMFLVNVWYPAPMFLTATLFLILMFIFFHGELTRQFSEKEKELGESRIAIMVSQIQPHFLYNSLNAIYYLCDKDTELAKEAINDFSEYLRHNLNSLKRSAPVCFEEELQYVKTYLTLEKMRFDEELNEHRMTESFMWEFLVSFFLEATFSAFHIAQTIKNICVHRISAFGRNRLNISLLYKSDESLF